MIDAPSTESTIVAAVGLLHERGAEGARLRASFHATGHWRCAVHAPETGGDPLGGAEALSYTSGRGPDILGDGRTAWTPESLADELEARLAGAPHARRRDPAYRAWFEAMRERTAGGGFIIWEDFYRPEEDWERRGLVLLLPGTAELREAWRGLDESHWTMPVPPAP
jgi:hypothetical protein